MKYKIRNTALAAALGLLLAGPAAAQTAPTPAQRKELDAARAQLDRAAQHYAELTRKYGGGDAPIRIEQRMLRKPVLGVVLAPDDAAGVRIAGITPDSAAAGAGLRSGDRIVRIGGKPLGAASGEARVAQARELLASLDDKTPVSLGYERDGKPAMVSVTPKVDARVMVLDRINGGGPAGPGGPVFIRRDDRAGAGMRDIELEEGMVAPDVRFEIMRVGKDCDGKPCDLPVLAEAFRWNGLNLAALDGQLGRYFGASEGVLVLSTGKDLDGLQAGDVIQRIGGKPVRSPREAMDLLRAQPSEGKVAVDYLRDRKPGSAQVAVPKAMPFALPRSAAAPGERRTMVFVDKDGQVQSFDGSGGKPPAGGPGKVDKRRIVMVDKDGKRQEWEGGAGDTPPAWAQAMPKDGQRVEKRVQVIVDDKGNRIVVDGDDLPPPPPPPLPPPPPPKVN